MDEVWNECYSALLEAIEHEKQLPAGPDEIPSIDRLRHRDRVNDSMKKCRATVPAELFAESENRLSHAWIELEMCQQTSKRRHGFDERHKAIRSLETATEAVYLMGTAIASRKTLGENAPQTSHRQPAIIDLSNRLYRIGAKEQLVSRAEDDVLQAFLQSPALDSADLISATESERAPRVLRELCAKYGGIFAPAITLAGRKGSGYVVRIRATE